MSSNPFDKYGGIPIDKSDMSNSDTINNEQDVSPFDKYGGTKITNTESSSNEIEPISEDSGILKTLGSGLLDTSSRVLGGTMLGPVLGGLAGAGLGAVSKLTSPELDKQVEPLVLKAEKKLEEAKIEKNKDKISKYEKMISDLKKPFQVDEPSLRDDIYEGSDTIKKEIVEAGKRLPSIVSIPADIAGGLLIGGPLAKVTGLVGSAVAPTLTKVIPKAISKLSPTSRNISNKAIDVVSNVPQMLSPTTKNITSKAIDVVSKAAPAGAAYGALHGATQGESKLLEGDFENFSKEVLDSAESGALYGAGAGLLGAGASSVFKKAKDMASDYIRKNPGTALASIVRRFKGGKEGQEFGTPEASSKLFNQAKDFIDETSEILRKQEGETINLAKQAIQNDTRTISLKALKNEVEDIAVDQLGGLNRHTAYGKDLAELIKYLRTEVGDEVPIKDAVDFLTKVRKGIQQKSFGDSEKVLNLKSDEAKELAEKTYQKIRSGVLDSIDNEDFHKFYKQYSNIRMQQDLMGLTSQKAIPAGKAEKILDGAKILDRVKAGGSEGNQVKYAWDKAVEMMKETNPELGKQIEDRFYKGIVRDYNLSNAVLGAKESMFAGPLGPVKTIGSGIAEVAGKAVKSLGESKKSGLLSDVTKAVTLPSKAIDTATQVVSKKAKMLLDSQKLLALPKQKMDEMIKKMSEKFKPIANQLQNINSFPEARRNALLIKLYEKPEVREALREVNEEE